jgi:DtxR family Mn-dependent transcriptional regulator
MDTASLSLSPEMEDYLETIALLFQRTGAARVTDIAEHLSVRKASVTQALRSLADKGLIHYRPYLSPTLTEAGQQIADRVQQRHDVLKRFLTDVLLVKPALAEESACRLEHAVDREVLTHLARFIDFVHRCPRGGAKWIRGYEYTCDPGADAEKCERCMEAALREYREKPSACPKRGVTMTLADLKSGEVGRILHVGEVGVVRRRIVDMGAVKGTRVTVVKVAPLGDPMEIKIRGYNLTLRRDEARAIAVEKPQDEEVDA